MIETIDLVKRYGDHTVLKGITTEIRDGEQVAIIGPSGSGKSTFLRCLNCMEDATSGSIIFALPNGPHPLLSSLSPLPKHLITRHYTLPHNLKFSLPYTI